MCGYLKQDQMEKWKTELTYWADQMAQEVAKSQTLMKSLFRTEQPG